MTYVIGTAGHVDHGKSTLVEALTGMNPDRLEEEQEREMTIDLGFAWLTLPGDKQVGIVDVPGHRDFIENMLAGVGGIDLALFVIAADEGVMPQTREHLAILDLLEISAGIIVLTKTDLVQDDEWLDLVTLDVLSVMENTVLQDAPIVPVSAHTGEGLEELLATLDKALSERPPQPDRGRPRLPIDRVFTISGFGTVVTGTLTGGSLTVGDEIEIVPGHQQARIRGLQSHKEPVETALPGSRVAVNLSGIDKEDVVRGNVAALPGLLKGTTLVDVQFRYLPDVERPLKHNTEVKFFSGAAETMAYARLVGDKTLSPGTHGWLQLRLIDPVALDKGDRFILRYPSPPQTIGGGVILDPHPPHRWRRFKPEVINRFETLTAGNPDEIILHVLEGHIAPSVSDLAAEAGLSEEELEAIITHLEDTGDVIRITDSRVIAYATLNRLQNMMVNTLEKFHQANPLRIGLSREEMRSRLRVDGKLFNQLVSLAKESNILIDEDAFLRHPDHRVTFTPQQQASIDRLWQVIQANPYAPPNVKEMSNMIGEEVYQALIEQKHLIQPSQDVVFDTATYQAMKQQVIDYLRTHDLITVADARDMFGSSRKYILALLEHMDAAGITIRKDDGRILRHNHAD